MNQIDARIFLLYVCLYFMLLHFHGNFGRIITSKNNFKNGYHRQPTGGFYPPYPSLYHTSVGYWNPNSLSSAANYGFGFGTTGSNPIDWQSHYHHQSAYWPNNPFVNAHGYHQKPFTVPKAASHLKQEIVYDQMPDNEDTLFSSIVRILNAESDNPNWNLWQQKQQAQALRRLTARKLLAEGDALSGSGKMLLAAYIKDELREKQFGFPGVENSDYPYPDAALFRSYAAHMSASFGNGDHTKSGGVIEIMYAEKVLGRRILTIEAPFKQTNRPVPKTMSQLWENAGIDDYRGVWTSSPRNPPLQFHRIRNWNDLFKKLRQNGLETTLVVLHAGQNKYRPLYQIPPSPIVNKANCMNLHFLNLEISQWGGRKW